MKEFEYRVEYTLDTDGKTVVAVVPELGNVSSFGSTFAEAEAHIRDAVLGYIETLVKLKKSVPAPAFKTEGTYLRIFVPAV